MGDRDRWRSEIGPDGDGDELRLGTGGGTILAVGGMGRMGRIEVLAEGMERDPTAAEFGLSQPTAAESLEEGLPAEIDRCRLRGTTWFLGGTTGPAGTIIAGSHAALQLSFTGRTRVTSRPGIDSWAARFIHPVGDLLGFIADDDVVIPAPSMTVAEKHRRDTGAAPPHGAGAVDWAMVTSLVRWLASIPTAPRRSPCNQGAAAQIQKSVQLT
jgi:hypothetical protein